MARCCLQVGVPPGSPLNGGGGPFEAVEDGSQRVTQGVPLSEFCTEIDHVVPKGIALAHGQQGHYSFDARRAGLGGKGEVNVALLSGACLPASTTSLAVKRLNSTCNCKNHCRHT